MAESKLEKLKKEATKIGLPYEPKVTEEELAEAIEKKKEAQAEEDRLEADRIQKAKDAAKKNKLVLKNTRGEDMDEKDYFYPFVPTEDDKKRGFTEKSYAPVSFNRTCGLPVDREELIEIFDRIFNPKENFLFYKVRDKEQYVIIVPLKFAATIGKHNDSVGNDFQRHSISFVGEGSVNLESMKNKLKKVAKNVSINREQF